MDLTDLDESLRHQVAQTFAQAGTTDPRFSDRIWHCLYEPEGKVGVLAGLGSYPNVNVMDGFAAVQYDANQYNLRLSRRLRPDLPELEHAAVGPLHVEVLEPYQKVRLVLDDGDHAARFDLVWRAVAPPTGEGHYIADEGGRRTMEYLRWLQLGTVDGYVALGTDELRADHWFCARDHSWGIRQGAGAAGGINTAVAWERSTPAAALVLYVFFLTESVCGVGMLKEDRQGNVLQLEMDLFDRSSAHTTRVTRLRHDITFRPGQRLYERVVLDMEDADGRVLKFIAEPMLRAWAYVGTGYEGGWNDGKGLGAWRSPYAVEEDVYRLSEGDDVTLPTGAVIRPFLREQGMRCVVNGQPGTAHVGILRYK